MVISFPVKATQDAVVQTDIGQVDPLVESLGAETASDEMKALIGFVKDLGVEPENVSFYTSGTSFLETDPATLSPEVRRLQIKDRNKLI